MIAARVDVSLAADTAKFHIRRTDDGFSRHGRGCSDVPRRVELNAVDRHVSGGVDSNMSFAVFDENRAVVFQVTELRPGLIPQPDPVVTEV